MGAWCEMRVLLVNKFHYRKGGAETYYLEIGAALERMGHEVAYFSMHHPLNLPCAYERFFVPQREYNNVKSPVKAVRDGVALLYSVKARRNFQALCEEFCPDIVHLNNVHRQITLSILDAPYLIEHHVPVVYTAHDYVTVCPGYLMLDGEGRVCDRCVEDARYRHCIENRCVKGSRAKSALAALEASFNRARRMNDKIDQVIAPSRFMAAKLVEGGWPSEKVCVLQNFANDEILARAKVAVSDVTDRENPYLLYFGRLSEEKGVDVLVDSFLSIASELPKWRLVVAGEGPARQRIENTLESSPYSSKVELVGYVKGDELRAYVERASLAIASSRCQENMPFSIIEAFAAGTPVVGARIGGIPELVSEGETGFLCEPGDVGRLAKAIERGIALCADRLAYEAMQMRCRSYVAEHCDQSRFMDDLIGLYERKIDAKRA
jgi:glycosyltransferase involved in cell wall biosynthesis